MNWFTADYHLGEERLSLLQRPFSSCGEMYNVLLENHNSLVLKDDTVYFVGDVVYQGAKDPKGWLDRIKNFNGNKILIRGNHDRIFTNEELSSYFSQIIEEGKGIDFNIRDTSCYITHYPTCGQKFKFNLVGHIHGAWKYQLNSLNVGIDVHHFKPMSDDKIEFYLNAITNFYDEDAWAAYHECNYKYRYIRGKEGSYIDRIPSKESCLTYLNTCYKELSEGYFYITNSLVAQPILIKFLRQYKDCLKNMKKGLIDNDKIFIKIPPTLSETLYEFCKQKNIRICNILVDGSLVTFHHEYREFEITGGNLLKHFSNLNYNIDSDFFVKSFS